MPDKMKMSLVGRWQNCPDRNYRWWRDGAREFQKGPETVKLWSHLDSVGVQVRQISRLP